MIPKKIIDKYTSFIFDLDGTIYTEEKLISGADKTINFLKEKGKKIVFISNKTTGSAHGYFLLLKSFNINVRQDEIINSSVVIKKFLKNNFPGKTFFAIGEKKFIEEIEREGLVFSKDPDKIEIVIVTLDRTLNFNKIEIAAKSIEKGARFFAANIDNTCPVLKGEITDAGVTIAALEKRTHKKLELHFGKPSKFMFDEIKATLKTDNSKILLVGDRLETDIAMGNIYGIDTALVATGIKNIGNVNSNIKPTYEIPSVANLLDPIPVNKLKEPFIK
jgi:HAD superfamily hydrolase (TIGR01450 family)